MSSFTQNKVARNVDIRHLEKLSLEAYKECPRFVTIVTHADRTDDSLFHCVPAQPFIGPKKPGTFFYHRDFIVPEQEIILLQDNDYGLFTLLRVMDSNQGPTYWLLSSVTSRMGFLVRHSDLPNSLVGEEEQLEEIAA